MTKAWKDLFSGLFHFRQLFGSLGAAGAFSFFFSANFGQIDFLVDDGVVRCQRGYNALALCIGLATMAESIALVWKNELLIMLAGGIL